MSDEAPTSDEQPTSPGLSFGAVAAAYERGRPSYPAEAAAWLMDGEARIVLELGAGTGKLTSVLVDQGHAVHATDPDRAMLDVLEQRVPGASVKQASAEEIPVNDRSVDVVVVAQAFHWLDSERALPEIARVLRPEGHLALVWNSRDERIPWVRRLGGTIGRQDADTSSVDTVVNSELFGFVEEKSFKHWQDVNRETFLDMARSRSSIATLGAEERAAKLAEVAALYDEYGRGMDGMQLPYVTQCFRAKVVDREEATTESPDGASHEGPIVSDGTNTDMLLIDFR